MLPAAHSQHFGHLADGRAVQMHTLRNALGASFSCIDYGATITALSVPDRVGHFGNVLLGLPDLTAYVATRRRFAAVMGRYAGRIGGAAFSLDGRQVRLPANGDGIHLHGDPDGFDKRLWQGALAQREGAQGVVLRLHSPEGDQGFPGALDVEVGYWLSNEENVLRLEYRVQTDQPTVLNLTNHAFFNLAGAGTRGLGTHVLQLFAGRVAQTDALRVPSGLLQAVGGTPLDFRQPARLGWRLTELGGPGFDHSYVFDKPAAALALVAAVYERVSGRCLRVRTDMPCAQLFTGNGFDGSETGSEGYAYQCHDGFALETQQLPDAPNHPHFPSTVLRPAAPFQSVTEWRFCTV